MSDPRNPNIKNRTTPQWSLYQREAFWGANEGKYPLFNTGMNDHNGTPNVEGLTKIRSGRSREIGQGKTLTGWLVSDGFF